MEGDDSLRRKSAELWRRWKESQTPAETGVALSKRGRPLPRIIGRHGGVAPPLRRRSARVLALAEREGISRGVAGGDSIRQIAARIGRSPSAVGRELARNCGRSRYRTTNADQRTWRCARRPKRRRPALHAPLQDVFARKPRLYGSPEQISGWLKRRFSGDPIMRVSLETIHRSIFAQAKCVLRRELIDHLRSRRIIRRSRHTTAKGQAREQIPGAVPNRARSPEAADRAVPVHWDGDLLSGGRGQHISTLAERRFRFTMLMRLGYKGARTVAGALQRYARRLPAELSRSLTWDRGMEMARHRYSRLATDVQVNRCDPQSPWQRGTNESTNRLLRQYFPKGTDLSGRTQAKLNRIARQLKERPRKTLGCETPVEGPRACFALTD